MPFRLSPAITSILWVSVIGAGIAAVLWIFGEIRAGAKAEVHAEYKEAARAKNLDIGDFNNASDAVDAVTDKAIAAALTKAANVSSQAKVTPQQADALNAIRKVR